MILKEAYIGKNTIEAINDWKKKHSRVYFQILKYKNETKTGNALSWVWWFFQVPVYLKFLDDLGSMVLVSLSKDMKEKGKELKEAGIDSVRQGILIALTLLVPGIGSWSVFIFGWVFKKLGMMSDEQLKRVVDFLQIQTSPNKVKELARVYNMADFRKKSMARESFVFEKSRVKIPVVNPGILGVPEGGFLETTPKHYISLAQEKGYTPVIRALTNLKVWNKSKNPRVASHADKMIKALQSEYSKRHVHDSNTEECMEAEFVLDVVNECKGIKNRKNRIVGEAIIKSPVDFEASGRRAFDDLAKDLKSKFDEFEKCGKSGDIKGLVKSKKELEESGKRALSDLAFFLRGKFKEYEESSGE